MPIALSVAGSDPTGGAGLQLDLQVFRALGVHGAGVITALTVQDTEKVHRVLPVFPSIILDQLRVVVRDLAVAAVKVGMLGTDDGLRAVAHGLEDPAACELPIVLDPVLESSSGAFLLERRAWPALVSLFPRAALVTPNVPELAALAEADVSTRAGIEAGARRLVAEANAQAVLVTGGHLEGAPDDLLARRDGGVVRLDWLPGVRIEGEAVHGTGCALSSAIAAELAKGAAIDEAVAAARAFVHDALRRARKVGRGARLLGLP
jgi:hydroxymethylpyrimidine/phosphomethylpyrimidine kinase